MANIQINEKNGRRKTKSPRVDLTPMVDLGFILITFFMFTTTLNASKALVLNTPIVEENSTVKTVYIDTSTVTIIPTKGHQYAYYYGTLDQPEEIRLTTYSHLRNIISTKQSELKRLPANFSEQARKIHVIIKPMDNSTYQDVVNVLDEMLINKVPYYTLDAITDSEKFIITDKIPAQNTE